jgi:TonB family protein
MRLSLLTALLFACPALAQVDWQVQRLVAMGKYPPLARMALIQGIVELRCSISEAGRATDCKVGSGHPLLFPAAVENIKRWTFRRSTERTEQSNEVIIYTFELTGEPARDEPRTEFSFEFPNHARFVSQPACASHVPCTPEEKMRWQAEQDARRRK